MRTFFAIAAVAAALTSTIGMAAEGEQRFVHEGSTYAYTVTPADNGSQVIEGRRLPNGRSFRLVVNDGRVSGVSGGVPVTFKVADARGAAKGFAPAGN